MVAVAGLTPAVPAWGMALLLVVLGASRSMQFTALNTLAFADMPQPWMAPANTWFSVGFQLSTGIGVSIGAGLLRVIAGGHAFSWTFLAVGGAMAVASLAALRLAPDAGVAVSSS